MLCGWASSWASQRRNHSCARIDESVGVIDGERHSVIVSVYCLWRHIMVSLQLENSHSIIVAWNYQASEIGEHAFWTCVRMTRVEFGRELETIDEAAFNYHPALQSINAICQDHWIYSIICWLRYQAFRSPRKSRKKWRKGFCWLWFREHYHPIKILWHGSQWWCVHWGCYRLRKVNPIGDSIHRIVSTLHMESWINETNEEIIIKRINYTLSKISRDNCSWEDCSNTAIDTISTPQN